MTARPAKGKPKADAIRQLWREGGMSMRAIARQVDCSPATVAKVIQTLQDQEGRAGTAGKAGAGKAAGPGTCQRPDVGNGLKPCGRPLHEIAGEKMGVCKHHWDIGRPITGQKLGQQPGVAERW